MRASLVLEFGNRPQAAMSVAQYDVQVCTDVRVLSAISKGLVMLYAGLYLREDCLYDQA